MKPEVLSDLMLEGVYEQAYLKACEYSEQYPAGLSSKNFNLEKPADRMRFFNETKRDYIQRATATAQRDADVAHYELLLKGLRKKLWLKHSCTGKYGDDGEMQCGAVLPPIDFLRDEWETLLDKISIHENYVRLDTANTAIEQARHEVAEELLAALREEYPEIVSEARRKVMSKYLGK